LAPASVAVASAVPVWAAAWVVAWVAASEVASVAEAWEAVSSAVPLGVV
jgi:hypothetical protein